MKRRSAMLFALLSALLLGGVCRAAGTESPAAAFNEGNAHYQSGDFAAAERSYRRLLDQGLDSGAVYYNLGNACFKQKRLGEAIYYWEKARRKLPGDSDIRENLQFANLLIVDRIDVPEDPIPVRVASSAVHLFTIAQESRIVLALFILANTLFGVYLLTRRPRLAFWSLTGSLAAALLMILFAGSLTWKVYQESHFREGVIVEQKVDIRSGPGAENITVVTVHEGVLVLVRGESNGWYQISLPNGWTGWLPATAIRVL
ncbi:MAG: tetratricopeptide repeat protein [Acidobacteriota bacterium]|jgi:tetratricopeptide (TPR) repeat protein